MRLITWVYNSFFITMGQRAKKRDQLNHVRGSYYFRVKGITPYLFYSNYSIWNLYQTMLYIIQYHYYSQTILCFIIHKEITLNIANILHFITALSLSFISTQDTVYMKYGQQTDNVFCVIYFLSFLEMQLLPFLKVFF